MMASVIKSNALFVISCYYRASTGNGYRSAVCGLFSSGSYPLSSRSYFLMKIWIDLVAIIFPTLDDARIHMDPFVTTKPWEN
jgi:hypothetical protein